MQRLASWLIGLLAVAVFAAAAYVVTKSDPVPDAGTVPAGASFSNTPGSADSTTASPAGGRVIAFLGDDWTSGDGASAKSKRFTSLLADQLGAAERNFGASGSGYAKSSGSGGAYDARVDKLVAAKPDVVIVSGGRNDTSDFVPTLRSRIKALFAQLHTRLPDATLIAVAPMWGDSAAPAELEPVAAAVKQYVTDAGGSYLDVTDPIRGHASYMSDAADPNDKGYAAIASALAPKIRALLS